MVAISFIFSVAILIFSVIIHEVSHGAVANRLGDPTAKNAGRLTLNPLKHLDPIGTIILPIFLILTTGRGIGWAKPVPINPYNFRDQKYGSLKVAIAGPASNLLIALFFGLLMRFTLHFNFLSPAFFQAVSFIVFVNILLAIFNLMPVPPLDGSHIFFTFMPRSMWKAQIFLSRFGFIILIFLIFFFQPFSNFLSYITGAIFNLIVGS
ncbi:MAG: site-2 protease family protein [Candidatus Nealsonbacteria bacterium]|nr:site-2 protease family protein [Candidatus Nealsonbacteria bacterium]